MLYANQTSAPSYDFASDAKQTFEKDMSLTLTEFVRALPKAVQGVVTRTSKSKLSFLVDYEDSAVVIHCRPMANRRLGSLSLPRLKVEIELSGFDEAETGQFFNRFDLAFLRMGG